MGALRRAAKAASSLVLARAEFAALELTQTGADALRWLLWALAATAIGTLALLTLTATIVLVLWDRFGWYAVVFLSLLYAGTTGYLIHRLWRALQTRPPLLQQTLSELVKDREALFHAGHDASPDRQHEQASG